MHASWTGWGFVLAAAVALSSCDRSPAPTSPDPATGPLRFSIVSGNDQTGAAGTQLAPLVVKVTKSDGAAQKNQILNFHVIAGGGRVFAGTGLTNNDGIAQELWTVGTRAGEPQKIEVRAVNPETGEPQVFATFTATVVAGPPVRMRIEAGGSQAAAPGGTAPVRPSVKLDDQYQNPTPNVTVTFAVTGGGGNITDPVAITDAQGVATAGTWTLGPVAGPNVLTATATGSGIAGNPIAFSAFGTCDCWTAKAPIQIRRYGAAAAGLDGKLYLVGGYTNVTNQALATLEVYDPVTDTWTSKAPMPTARLSAGAAVIDGILYVVGGDNIFSRFGTLEAYDPASDTWTTKAPMPTPRTQLGVAVVDGILYAIGGINVNTNDVATVEAYDPATDTWTTKAPMSTGRRGPGVAEIDGIIYAAGGANSGVKLATTEAYDPSTNRWTQKAPMTQARYALGLATTAGGLYAVGGQDNNGPQTGSVERYDPVTNAWNVKASMPMPRSYLAVGVVNGVIYAVAGSNITFSWPFSYLTTNEAYQP